MQKKKNTGEKISNLQPRTTHLLSLLLSFFVPPACCLCPVCCCSGRWAILIPSWVLAHGEEWEDADSTHPSPPRQHTCPGKMLPRSIREIQGGRATVTHCTVKGNVSMSFLTACHRRLTGGMLLIWDPWRTCIVKLLFICLLEQSDSKAF